MASAAGRRRSNHGETMALTAAALMALQPAPLKSAAANSCQGAAAIDQANTPSPRHSAAARVAPAMPSRRLSAGRLPATSAPIR